MGHSLHPRQPGQLTPSPLASILIYGVGGVAERTKAAVLKTAVPLMRHRGFESLPLRQTKMKRNRPGLTPSGDAGYTDRSKLSGAPIV